MPIGLYMDVHVPQAVTDQLRRRGAEVVTAIEDSHAETTDEQLLQRASDLGRVVFTQDIRFKAMAEAWQREGRDFMGVLFGHQLGATIGKYVSDLELIALASDPKDWTNTVQHLPL